MKHRWVVFLFAAVFAIAVAAGLALRRSANKPADTQSDIAAPTESATDTPSDASAIITAETAEPVTSTSPTVQSSEPTAMPETLPETTQELPEPEPESYPVRICIGGDTSIDSEFADFARMKGVDYPWADISDLMNSADIAIVNLETCVSERGVSEKKEGYGFETPPEMLEGFKNAGIDAVNLANNHVRDFGPDALLDTFSNLDSYGISYFGAGADLDEAGALRIIEKNGVKIGLTGANNVSLKGDCFASEDHAGINQIGKTDSASTLAYIDRIKEYDAMCDVLIVFLHAGTEEVFEPDGYQKDMAKKFIDAGADVVVGGHSHTIQPIEFYNEKPIIYSIGNLIFWHLDDDIDGLTAIFDLTVGKDGFISLKLHPLVIKNYKVYLLNADGKPYAGKYQQILRLANDICEPYDVWFDGEGQLLRGIPEEILEQRRIEREAEAAAKAAEQAEAQAQAEDGQSE